MGIEKISFRVHDMKAAIAKACRLPGVKHVVPQGTKVLEVVFDNEKVAAKMVVKTGKKPISGPVNYRTKRDNLKS